LALASLLFFLYSFTTVLPHFIPRQNSNPRSYRSRQNATPDERKEYFAQQQQRQKTYADAAKEFARVLIIVSTPLGLAAILVGAYLSFQAVGTGLIFGGIFAVSWGYWSYWWYLDDWIRFVSLLAGFVILIFVGIRRAGAIKPS
jgi:uncharacterized membrane protein YphA (DoxX/SURF4 family)